MRVPLMAALIAGAAFGQSTVFEFRGTTAGQQYGYAACTPGDLNSDGISDVVVGVLATGAAGQVEARSGFDGSLIWAVTSPAMTGASGLLPVGDVNADGVPDVVAEWSIAPMVVGVSALSGANGAALWTYVGPAFPPSAPRLESTDGDVDGDGIRDVLVTILQPWTNTIELRVVSGSNGSAIGVPYPIGSYTANWSLHPTLMPDVSGDGLGELAVGNSSLNQVVVLSGPARVLVHAITGPSGFGSRVWLIADVNADGKADLAVSTQTTTRVHSGGNGSFLYSIVASAAGAAGGRCFSTGDFTGDGRQELFLESFTIPTSVSSAWSLCSGSNGAVLWNQTYFVSGTSRAVPGPDLTFDGFPEILYCEPLDDTNGTDAGRLSIISLLTLPAASAVNLGGSCGSQLGNLVASPPVVGSTMTIVLSGAAPSAVGNLVIDIAPDVPTFLPGGCVFHIDLAHLASWILIPIGTGAAGTTNVQIPIPTIPYLANLVLTMQVCLLSTPGPLGFDLSNGVRITLGY